MFPGRKLRQRPPGCGNTAIATPAPREWTDSILHLTHEIFSTIGFEGLGSVEYKVRQDDSLAIMEPTVGRTNWQSEIAVLNGLNIPAIAYFDALGQEWNPRRPPSARACKLVDGRADLWALRQTLRRGELKFSQWLRDRRGRKRYMRWRFSDPLPSIAALGHFLFRIFRYGINLPLRLSRRLFTSKSSGRFR
jgi:predicted ATP-grasp superfamily ATP-dependent carboligase